VLSHRPLLDSTPGQTDEVSLLQTPPEINLIPFIDVLLVILIFLMISTTFTQYQQLSINLPTAQGITGNPVVKEMKIAISKEGRYALNGVMVDIDQLGTKINQIAKQWNVSQNADLDPINLPEQKNGRIVISADAKASHQSVMFVLELAGQANITQVVFATQDSNSVKSKK
jgi:biopolymer transport protein ExbD